MVSRMTYGGLTFRRIPIVLEVNVGNDDEAARFTGNLCLDIVDSIGRRTPRFHANSRGK